MPNIIILPNERLCPNGYVIECQKGYNLCEALLEHDIAIEHACDRACACTTCHVIVHEGSANLNPASDQEEDMLDKAWGLKPSSRLSCQVVIGDEDLVIEIPKYTINHAREE